MEMNLGATAFSADAAPKTETVTPFLDRAAKIGLSNLQFLLDHVKTDGEVELIGKMCRSRGITPLTIGVTFHPVCAIDDPDEAAAYVLETVRKARILSGDSNRYGCVVSGPFLRGLVHPRKGGLPLASDRKAQVTFLKRLGPDLRKVKGLTFCLEPLNRTEAPSANKVGDIVSIIDDADVGDVCKVLADTVHMHLSELDPVTDVLSRYHERIGHIHFSEVNRASLRIRRAVTPEIVQMVAEQFPKVHKTMESFTAKTPEGFFGALMVNDLENIEVIDLFERDFALVQSYLS